MGVIGVIKSIFGSASNKKSESNASSEGHTLQYEFEVLMEDYRASCAEIARALEADEKGFELTVVAVGAVVAASAIVVDQRAYVLLLALAVPFHVLIWAHIRRAVGRFSRGKYIREVLVPRLDTIIQRTSIDTETYGQPLQFQSWEGYLRSYLVDKPLLESSLPLSSTGKILVEFGTAIVLLVAYILLWINDSAYATTAFDYGLLVLNVLVAIVSVVYLWIAFRFSGT